MLDIFDIKKGLKRCLKSLVMDINKSTKRKYKEIEYDYENFYDTSSNQIEDAEIEKLLKKSLIDHHYVAKTILAGNQFEVELYPAFSKKDIDKFKPKKRPSKKNQKNLNEKNARKRFVRLINNNFNENDFVIHLTYTNENLPPTEKEAHRKVVNYLRRINYARKKIGLDNAKYVFVTEFDKDKKIRVHHHLIIEGGLEREKMKKLWTDGKRTRVEELEPDEFGLAGLANYLAKDPKGKKRWTPSKNLKQPVERKSYTSFSKRKIRNMIAEDSLISTYMNSNYKSKQYLDHEIRYNQINHMYYIYVRMKVRDRPRIERRNI